MITPRQPAVPAGSVSPPQVELLTRPDCHLCADARSVVEKVCSDLGLTWRERSGSDEPALLAEFAEEIPVLFINGVQRDFWTIDETRLRSLLAP